MPRSNNADVLLPSQGILHDRIYFILGIGLAIAGRLASDRLGPIVKRVIGGTVVHQTTGCVAGVGFFTRSSEAIFPSRMLITRCAYSAISRSWVTRMMVFPSA